MDVRDTETGEGIDWSSVFFRLHHYCNLNKWEIYDYTLPQISELLRMTNQHIQFEVQLKGAPLGMFGGSSASSEVTVDGDYEEVTEDDITSLARILGGG